MNKELKNELMDVIENNAIEVKDIEELEEMIAPACGCGCGGLC